MVPVNSDLHIRSHSMLYLLEKKPESNLFFKAALKYFKQCSECLNKSDVAPV